MLYKKQLRIQANIQQFLNLCSKLQFSIVIDLFYNKIIYYNKISYLKNN